jgi:hypothetical protein
MVSSIRENGFILVFRGSGATAVRPGRWKKFWARKFGGPTGGGEAAETVDRSFPRHAAAEMGVKIACLAPVGALR